MLALALTTIPAISGNLDRISEFVQVIKLLAAVALQVFTLGNNVRCAHLYREMAKTGKPGDGWNERWIVNSHIDLAACNNVLN
jgi:hypothetical protein